MCFLEKKKSYEKKKRERGVEITFQGLGGRVGLKENAGRESSSEIARESFSNKRWKRGKTVKRQRSSGEVEKQGT